MLTLKNFDCFWVAWQRGFAVDLSLGSDLLPGSKVLPRSGWKDGSF